MLLHLKLKDTETRGLFVYVTMHQQMVQTDSSKSIATNISVLTT